MANNTLFKKFNSTFWLHWNRILQKEKWWFQSLQENLLKAINVSVIVRKLFPDNSSSNYCKITHRRSNTFPMNKRYFLIQDSQSGTEYILLSAWWEMFIVSLFFFSGLTARKIMMTFFFFIQVRHMSCGINIIPYFLSFIKVRE